MPPFELVVFHGGTTRVVALPTRGTVGIGRDPEQAVRINEPTVSRRHATLTLEPDTAIIEDEKSANGTIVVRGDGKGGEASPNAATAEHAAPLLQPTELRPGDSICLGAATMVLRQLTTSERSSMASLDRLVAQIAPTPIRVLLLGETGVGKEVLAERIHRQSPRAAGPLVKVHCASLSETLLESELFGHEKGAFTGAVRARVGLVEGANGGTLLLDEVGEMSAAVQVKLLRVLEDGRVQRVGSNEARPVDVRVLSATHRELLKEVKSGLFRQDLYFRINGITLRIPPLRERRDEIVPLALELLGRAAEQAQRSMPGLDDAARERLIEHDWPGNVRELRQVMERALALSLGDTIKAAQIVLDEAPPSSLGASRTLRGDLDALERRRIEEALASCGGNQSRAAEMLGMPRRTLVERLREWGLTRPRPK
jgi:two-component system response regulator AtoC